MGSIKLRAKTKDGMIEVKTLITHPMETGNRKDKKTKELIPAHFITEVKVEANGEEVLRCDWGGSVSKNPFLSFFYEGKKGDKIKLSWIDNKGESDSIEKEVKK